jgi:hypothetical protein
MKAIIDTSSLISLVRYYSPFDEKDALHDYVVKKITTGEFLVLDKVADECKNAAKSIVVNTFEEVNHSEHCVSTKNLLPTKSFFGLLENNFINKIQRNKITDAEFEVMKGEFIESGDGAIMYSMSRQKRGDDDIIVVTEETSSNNDGKSFKKLPLLCKIIDVPCITLPDLLQKCNGIIFSINTDG